MQRLRAAILGATFLALAATIAPAAAAAPALTPANAAARVVPTSPAFLDGGGTAAVRFEYQVRFPDGAPLFESTGGALLFLEIPRPDGAIGAPTPITNSISFRPTEQYHQALGSGWTAPVTVGFHYDNEPVAPEVDPVGSLVLEWTFAGEGEKSAGASLSPSFYRANGECCLGQDIDPSDDTAIGTATVIRPTFGDAAQGVTATVTEARVLSIDVLSPTVAFGEVEPGAQANAPVGRLRYTNSLLDGAPWTVSVVAYDLSSSVERIDYEAMSFSPGSTFGLDDAVGLPPTQGHGGYFTGSGVASDPITVLQAPPGLGGVVDQDGSILTFDVPSNATAGDYLGAIQYTIVG